MFPGVEPAVPGTETAVPGLEPEPGLDEAGAPVAAAEEEEEYPSRPFRPDADASVDADCCRSRRCCCGCLSFSAGERAEEEEEEEEPPKAVPEAALLGVLALPLPRSGVLAPLAPCP